MKIDYEKVLIHLKIALLELRDNRKNDNIKNKIKLLINEINQIKIKEKKNKIKIKNNFNFISKQPEKSIQVIENLIEKELNSLDKKDDKHE